MFRTLIYFLSSNFIPCQARKKSRSLIPDPDEYVSCNMDSLAMVLPRTSMQIIVDNKGKPMQPYAGHLNSLVGRKIGALLFEAKRAQVLTEIVQTEVPSFLLESFSGCQIGFKT